MIKERLFDTWEEGLFYLIFSLFMPLLSLIVYLVLDKTITIYLYALLLTIIITLLYELFKIKECGARVFIEKIISICTLVVMFFWNLGLLFYYSQSKSKPVLSWQEIVITCLFIIPIAVIINEIRCCIVNTYLVKKNKISNTNLIEGGGHV